jgi:F5/8 type C domain
VTGTGSASQQLVALTGDGLSAVGDFAEGRPVTVSSILDGWDPNSLTDGNVNTFWEAKPDVFPASATIDIQDTVSIGRAVFQPPDNPAWGSRTETIEIQGSTDGTTFSTLQAATPVTLDAVNAHNTATVSFAPGTARRLRDDVHRGASAHDA